MSGRNKIAPTLAIIPNQPTVSFDSEASTTSGTTKTHAITIVNETDRGEKKKVNDKGEEISLISIHESSWPNEPVWYSIKAPMRKIYGVLGIQCLGVVGLIALRLALYGIYDWRHGSHSDIAFALLSYAFLLLSLILIFLHTASIMNVVWPYFPSSLYLSLTSSFCLHLSSAFFSFIFFAQRQLFNKNKTAAAALILHWLITSLSTLLTMFLSINSNKKFMHFIEAQRDREIRLRKELEEAVETRIRLEAEKKKAIDECRVWKGKGETLDTDALMARHKVRELEATLEKLQTKVRQEEEMTKTINSVKSASDDNALVVAKGDTRRGGMNASSAISTLPISSHNTAPLVSDITQLVQELELLRSERLSYNIGNNKQEDMVKALKSRMHMEHSRATSLAAALSVQFRKNQENELEWRKRYTAICERLNASEGMEGGMQRQLIIDTAKRTLQNLKLRIGLQVIDCPSHLLSFLPETYINTSSSLSTSSGVGASALVRQKGAVYVASIVLQSPAADSGLAEGDIILRIDSDGVENMQKFEKLVNTRLAGDEIMLEVLRGDNIIIIPLLLAAMGMTHEQVIAIRRICSGVVREQDYRIKPW